MKPFFEDPFLRTTPPGVDTEIPVGPNRQLQVNEADGGVDLSAGEEAETRPAPITVACERSSPPLRLA